MLILEKKYSDDGAGVAIDGEMTALVDDNGYAIAAILKDWFIVYSMSTLKEMMYVKEFVEDYVGIDFETAILLHFTEQLFNISTGEVCPIMK